MDILSIQLDFQNKKNLCEQIYTEIRSQILMGQIAPGEKLPTVREVAVQLKINFNTVARAYRVLDQEGWIITRQGRGTFVTNKGSQEPVDRQQMKEAIASHIVNSLQVEAQRTGISAAEIWQDMNHKMIEKGLLTRTAMDKKPYRRKGKILHKPGRHMRIEAGSRIKRTGRKTGKIKQWQFIMGDSVSRETTLP